MENDVKVSIIMAVYNAQDTVSRAIESMLGQTFKEIEIIAVDDCSTDKSYELLLEWAKKEPKVRVFRNEKNMYIGHTYNKGLKAAKGEFLAMQDSDDTSAIDRIEKQYNFLLANKQYGWVGSGLNILNDNGESIGKRTSKAEPVIEDFLWGTCFSNATVMFRAEMIRHLNYYSEREDTKRVEDYDLWMRAYQAGYKGYNLSECLYNYYEGDATLSHRRYKYRINEAKIRYRNYKKLKLMPKGYIYTLKPLVVGLLPKRFIQKLNTVRK